ncbi:hypothetical protein ABW19_dt0210341 [Dactylella cylindrospora]|nr:hypothetical protein ABW19_dt0210341 [Dactylella cylindrospora]
MSPTLAPELWLIIFKHLDYCTIHAKVKLVCREFYNLSFDIRLSGLTPNLWLAIFVKHLDYFQLHATAPRVCKPFHRLLKNANSPELDAKLFREKPGLVKITKHTKITLNPIFSHITNINQSSIDRMAIITSTGDPAHLWGFKSHGLRRCPCMNQNATSPPVKKATVRYWLAPIQEINHSRKRKNPQNVTVRDVMEACAKSLAAKVVRPKIMAKLF